MLATNLTNGRITIRLDVIVREAWVRMWEDLGRLASEEMPEEHRPRKFFNLGRTDVEVACQCFTCRAWLAYKLATSPVPKVGRNEPCPCGTGRKYKRCHAVEKAGF